MNYFTPDLFVRMQSDDDDVLDAVDAEWEAARRRYRERLSIVRSKFPESVRRHIEKLSLHDAEVLSLARENGHFVCVLLLDAPRRQTVILTYTLAGDASIDKSAIPAGFCTPHVRWLYDEWDVAPRTRKQFVHRILLSNGWELRLRFRNLQVVVANAVLQPERPNERMAEPLPA